MTKFENFQLFTEISTILVIWIITETKKLSPWKIETWKHDKKLPKNFLWISVIPNTKTSKI